LRHTARKSNSETHDENSDEELSACIDPKKRPVGEENDIQTQRRNGVDSDGSIQDDLLELEQDRRHDHNIDFAIDFDGSNDGSVCNLTRMVSRCAIVGHRIN